MASENSHLTTLRVAAAGDIHCRESRRAEVAASFAEVATRADLILLAGDLTAHGEPAEARVLADACRDLDVPVLAVLGNHDWHAGHEEEVVAVLEEAGVKVLERSWTIAEVGGLEVGIVGTKGFVGGFPGSHLPDFGEPLLRRVYAEASADVEAIDAGLRAVAVCPLRIVLLHYSPAAATLAGEPEGIWAFLGTDRMAPPIAEHAPDLVVHGHAHAGRFEGAIGEAPVYNVSVPVIERDFWLFELSGISEATTPVH
jgi:Icc-related predicted phosphoesterase